MRILRVIAGTDATEGGPIEGVRQISKVLSARGHATEIASLDREGSPWLRDHDVSVHALGSPNDHYLDAPRLRDWLIENAGRFDIIVQHGLWNPTGFATWHASRKTGREYLLYSHGMLDPWFKHNYPVKHVLKQIVWLFADGRVARDARYVLFTSQQECHLARKTFWPNRYKEKVVRYGTADVIVEDREKQIVEFREMCPRLRERPYLLFLSRIHPKKGCDILIEAFARMARDNPNVDLVIAGPDEAGIKLTLAAQARKLGVQERIHWPGMLRLKAKWGAFFGCEAFVLSSHQENFGISVAEAMACGRPVLITNKVNICEEVKACGGGLVGSDDVEGVYDMLRKFIGMSLVEKAALGKGARSGFLANFEILKVAESFLAVVDEVVHRPKTFAFGNKGAG